MERFHGAASGVETKSSATDPVSDADRDAEALITELLRAERPHDALLGEEGAGAGGESGLEWVIDPLDGTVNFLYGIPQWAVSIACRDGGAHGGRSRARPAARRDLQRGPRAGLPAERRALRLGDAPPLAHALVGTGFSYVAAERGLQTAIVARVLPLARDIRRAGSAALDLAWVAAGRLDAFYEHGLAEWDHAAGDLLVREAGGVVLPLPAAGGLRPGVLAGASALAAELAPLLLDTVPA